jgi:hypothetical protein
LLLLEEVWNIDAIELRLEMFEQKREVENHRVVIKRICRIRAAIETFDEWRDRLDNLCVRCRLIKCAISLRGLASKAFTKPAWRASMVTIDAAEHLGHCGAARDSKPDAIRDLRSPSSP